MTTKLQQEIEYYEAHRATFVEEHPDEFALIKGAALIGFYKDEVEAIRAGHAKFGNEPFLVRKVAESEAPVLLASLNLHVLRCHPVDG